MDVRTELSLARAALEAVVDFNNATLWTRSMLRGEKTKRTESGVGSEHWEMLLANCTKALGTPLGVLNECRQKLIGGSLGHELTEVCDELCDLRDEYVRALCAGAFPNFEDPILHPAAPEDAKKNERCVIDPCEGGPDCARHRDFAARLAKAVARAETCIYKHIRRLDEQLG